MTIKVIRHGAIEGVFAQVVTHLSLSGRFEAIFQCYVVNPDGRTAFVSESIWLDKEGAIKQFDKYFTSDGDE